MEGLPGLIGIGIVAVVGFLMARSFGTGRKVQGSSSDNGVGYEGPGASSAWFGGLFGASLGASSSHEGGGSSDNNSDNSSNCDGGGAGGGGGGGD